MSTVILHDTRLDGRVQSGSARYGRVDESISLNIVYKKLRNLSITSPAELVIACHGFTTHEYPGQGMSKLKATGGQGLLLCKENLTLDNISTVSQIKGLYSRIWIMACAPAGVAVHDSRPFCRKFAHYADTPVIASDSVQWYHDGTYDPAKQISRRALKFGQWEGEVYRFLPTGEVERFRQSQTPLP